MQTLHIDLNEHSYDILIHPGLLDHAGALIRQIYSKSRAVVLTDDRVFSLYGDRLLHSLAQAQMEASVFSVAPGEASKTMTQLERLLDFMAASGLTRSGLLIALGGGVVGDLGGFAAAVYMRGIDFVQIPTTLLAQVDSSVGGKTAVNLQSAKNLAGAFWQPRLVISDTSLLSTLSRREFSGGMAEVIKYGCILDSGLFSLLQDCPNRKTLIEQMPSIVKSCCYLKQRLVEEDERDVGRRMLLNFGHTFGHAVEANGHYQNHIHGEAVALGMILAAAYGRLTKVTSEDIVSPLKALLSKFGLPVSCHISPENLIEPILIDKKADGERLRLILLHRLGDAFVQTVTKKELAHTLRQLHQVWEE